MIEGWKCPNCGKAHAPDVKTCPEPASAWPNTPRHPSPPMYPIAPVQPLRMPDPVPGTPWPGEYPIITCQADDPHNANGGTSYSVPL